MTRVLDLYCRFLEYLIAFFLAVMVVLVFGNVVLRYAFNSGITMSEEVSRWLFIWLTFLGAVVALKEHGHLGTDLLVSRLPLIGKKICLIAGQCLMLFIIWLILQGSWQQARINWDVDAPVTGASMAIVYGVGVVFAISAGLILLRDLWRAASGQLSEADLIMIRESEEQGELDALKDALALGQAGHPASMPSEGTQQAGRK